MPLFLLSPPVFGFPTPKQQAVESISLPYPHPLDSLMREGKKMDFFGTGRVWLTKIWSIFIIEWNKKNNKIAFRLKT